MLLMVLITTATSWNRTERKIVGFTSLLPVFLHSVSNQLNCTTQTILKVNETVRNETVNQFPEMATCLPWLHTSLIPVQFAVISTYEGVDIHSDSTIVVIRRLRLISLLRVALPSLYMPTRKHFTLCKKAIGHQVITMQEKKWLAWWLPGG